MAYHHEDFNEGEQYQLATQRDDEHLKFDRIEWISRGASWQAVFTESETGGEIRIRQEQLSTLNLTEAKDGL